VVRDDMTSRTARSYPFSRNRLDPDPQYAELRRSEPVCRVQLPYGPPAWLVTAIIICELLGIPAADRHAFRRWTDAVVSTSTSTPEQVQDTYLHLAGYLAGLFAQRRAQPGNDLLTWLVQARDNEDRLTEAELLFLGMALLVGGYETTAHQITNMVYTLLTHDRQLRQLKARPELLPNAVEEMLRFIVFGNALNPRIATGDVKLGAVLIRAGEPVLCSRSSANHDEQVFSRAGELDFTRDPNPHVAFGYGPHYCLGAHLARMELQVALGTILPWLPGLHIAVPEEELTWQAGTMMRGLSVFPLGW
jgi:cytochrome P450